METDSSAGPSPSEFDEATYLELNPDVATVVASGGWASGLEHWQAVGRAEGRLAVYPAAAVEAGFDELEYLHLNHDVEAAVLRGEIRSGLEHWLKYGIAEGRILRQPAGLPPDWDEARYLRLNPDVPLAINHGGFASGYQHWQSIGRYEARPGAPQPYSRTSLQDALRQAPAGINLFGFSTTDIGLGTAARGYAEALRQLLPVAEMPIPWKLAEMEQATPTAPPYAINLIHLNPDALPMFLRHYGEVVLPGRFNVAAWVWELHAGYPAWHSLSRIFHEIWTLSAFSAASIATVSAVPTHVIPPVIDRLPEDGPGRADFGWDENAFIFLYIFDIASSIDRKNPLAAIRAFQKVFGDRADVRLVLKYHHADDNSTGAALLERAARSASNVQIISASLPESSVYGLLRACDCFVSPHRSEGFGLNLAAAMYYGKPVIATAFSGNLDFTNEENSFLLDCDRLSVQGGSDAYKTDYAWADPSDDHLATLMRTVVECPAEAKRRGQNARKTILRQFNRKAVVEAVKQRLAEWGIRSKPRGWMILRDL
jgi:glycosyltransferase involved in cell wall biosynthesis